MSATKAKRTSKKSSAKSLNKEELNRVTLAISCLGGSSLVLLAVIAVSTL